VAPAGEPGQLPAEDRSAIVTLRRWACEPLFLQRSVTFCLLVETTATLSAALVSDARTFEIAVPVPDEQERYAYLAGRGSRPETFSTRKRSAPASRSCERRSASPRDSLTLTWV